jgi:thioester reductase-like protein
MGDSGYVLLSGATGFLGRYLLHDLRSSGRCVAVLVRGSRKQTAKQRIAAVSANGPASVPAPVILEGDLAQPGLGLTAAERRWIATHCRTVIHAAARTALPGTADGEPWRSNVEGTQNLLKLCIQLGLVDFHHVSTAFVCGDRSGMIREEELECGQGFHNPYERSKCEAELRVRQATDHRATIYRPSVIVGDSRTGFTSAYQGVYRFLELADRLANGTNGRRTLPLRLPLTGDEPRNLVPVDWVAQAIVRIVNRPQWHGRTYHLVARQPVRAAEIRDIAVELLGLDGVQWAGGGPLEAPSALEEMFLDYIREYWPYFRADPVFDYRNTIVALPDLPPPRLDRALLTRLIRFGIADRWGRASRARSSRRDSVDVAHYLEHFFPRKARQSTLAALPLDMIIAFDIQGYQGGQWSCEWQGGELTDLRRGLRPDAELTYRMDVATFAAVVRGRQAAHEAFFARQIEVSGDIEKALKLAVLFGQFVKEFPYRPRLSREKVDGAACPE